jgi:hypothetical protein
MQSCIIARQKRKQECQRSKNKGIQHSQESTNFSLAELKFPFAGEDVTAAMLYKDIKTDIV